jgi:hypothetical protein
VCCRSRNGFACARPAVKRERQRGRGAFPGQVLSGRPGAVVRGTDPLPGEWPAPPESVKHSARQRGTFVLVCVDGVGRRG